MKHLAIIQTEFFKNATKWNDLSREQQQAYLKRHPKSKRRLTNTKENSIDINKVTSYINQSDKKTVKKALTKLYEYIDSQSGVTFSNNELQFLINVPGFPNYKGHKIYRCDSFDTNDDDGNILKKKFKSKSVFTYIPKRKQFSSWSLSSNSAEEFKDTSKIDNSFLFETIINQSYIDVFSWQKYLNNIKIKGIKWDGTVNEDEKEILIIDDVKKVKVIKFFKSVY